jgi:hypothetical protein
MPVVTMLEFPGITKQTYEALGASLASGEPPNGIVFHSCGAVPGGWRIVDIWNTQDEFDRFVDHVLLPAARALGLSEPSKRETFLAHHAGQVIR